MKLAAKILTCTSVLLFWSGSNLFVKTKAGRFIRRLFQAWLLVVIVCAFHVTLKTWLKNGMSLSSLAFTAYDIGIVVCYAVIICRRQAFESLIKHIITHVRCEDLRRLYIESVVLISLMYSEFFAMRLVQVFLLENPSREFPFLKDVTLVVELTTPNWIAVTCIFYFIVFRLLSFYHMLLIEKSLQILIRDPREVQVMRVTMTHIRDTSREFDGLFNIMPFMWFVHGILAAPAYVLYLTSQRVSDALTVLPFILVSLLSPIAVTLTISQLQSSFFVMLDNAQSLIIRSISVSETQELLLLRDMDSLKSIRFTGCSFFSLDKSFIMAYLGSVVTFASLIATYANRS